MPFDELERARLEHRLEAIEEEFGERIAEVMLQLRRLLEQELEARIAELELRFDTVNKRALRALTDDLKRRCT